MLACLLPNQIFCLTHGQDLLSVLPLAQVTGFVAYTPYEGSQRLLSAEYWEWGKILCAQMKVDFFVFLYRLCNTLSHLIVPVYHVVHGMPSIMHHKFHQVLFWQLRQCMTQ